MDTGGGGRAWSQCLGTGEGRHSARVPAVETENKGILESYLRSNRPASEGRGCQDHSEYSRFRNVAGFQLGS